jgi:hypothetical protein
MVSSSKFAIDWKHQGDQKGGKKFKTDFARNIYKAHIRTGHSAPIKQFASKQDKKSF